MLDKAVFYAIFCNNCSFGNYQNSNNPQEQRYIRNYNILQLLTYGAVMIGNKAEHNNSVISARQIVKRFNISYQTVNHYTDFGLLDVAFKKGNVRFYNKNEVKHRLVRIAKLAREGYSLRLIRRKLIGL